MPSDLSIPSPRPPRWPALALVVAFLALALPIILSGDMRGRGAFDQFNFHEKTVRALAADWPRFDFWGDSYLTATTPAFHLILAAAIRAGLDSTTALRLISCAITAGFLLTLGLWVCRRLPPMRALAACLPVAASLYIFQSGAWAVPDNTGWWGVLVILLIALRPRFDSRSLVWGGIALVLLVLTRQIHLWAAAPLWAAAWLGSAVPSPASSSPHSELSTPHSALFSDLPHRLRRAIAAGIASLPAIAALAAFILLWRGLTPPNFQAFYHGRSPAAGAWVLALLGFGSLFFAPYFAAPLLTLAHRRPIAIAGAAIAGALAAAIPATTYGQDGRSSGIWNAVKHIPVIAGHTSPLILVLAVIGAIALLGWSVALRQRERWIILAVVAAFTAAQAASGQLWERYTEPFILILLALLAALTAPNPAPPLLRRLRTVGPLALGALLLAVTIQKLATDKPAKDLGRWDPATTSTNSPD